MQKLKNKTKSMLAFLLSAAVAVSAVPVGQAAAEEAVIVAEDAENAGLNETAEVPEASQAEITLDFENSQSEIAAEPEISQSEADAASADYQDGIIVEEVSRPDQPEAAKEPGVSELEGEPQEPEVSNAAEVKETESAEDPEISEAGDLLEIAGTDGILEVPEPEELTEAAAAESEIELLDDEETAAEAKETADDYWLNIWDGNNGVFELLPGQSMELSMQLWKNDREDPLDPSEYTLTWASSNKNVATIKADKDRDDLQQGEQVAIITAAEKVNPDKENKTVITVKAQVGSVTKTEKLDLYVHDGIWVITPRDDYNIQLYPGQSWESGVPQMTYYELGKEPQVKNNIKFKWVYNPDKNGNDTYGKNEPVSLKRGKNGELTVTAGNFNGKYGERIHIDLVATDPEDKDFQISNGFEVEVLYFEEHNLQNNIQGNLYTGDSATFTVNTDQVDERLIKSNPTVEWTVLKYDEASKKNKATTDATVTSVPGNKYKAKITHKKPGEYSICAKLKINGRTAAEIWGYSSVRSETKEYIQWYSNDLIPGYEIRLEDQSSYYVDTKKVQNREFMLQYQNVKSGNPHAVSVRIEDGKTVLRAENQGTAMITGSMIWKEDSGKSHKEAFKVTLSVSGTTYRADLYKKSGGDILFPKETRQLVLDVWEENINSVKKLDPKKYTVKWKVSNKDVLSVSSNGKVTAKNYGDSMITAEITIKESKYKLQEECWMGVSEEYSDITPKSMDKRLYPGDVVSLKTPVLYQYKQGKKAVVADDVEFEWLLNPDGKNTWNDLSTDIFSLKFDENNNIRNITVNRMPVQKEYEAGENLLHIELIGRDKKEGYEIAHEYFDFRVEHTDSWIDSSDQKNYTGDNLKMTWNGDFDGNSKNLKIKWHLREQVWSSKKGDYVDAKAGTVASVSAKGNGKTATLKLLKCKDGQGRVFVTATALYKGTAIGDTDEREYVFYDPSEGWACSSNIVYTGTDYILNDEIFYRVDNKTYPETKAFAVTAIKNVKIVKQKKDDSSKGDVLKLTKKANGKVVLTGLNSGQALVSGEFTAKVGKKTVKGTYQDWYRVTPANYEVRVVNEKGTDNAFPGSSVQFSLDFRRKTATGNQQVDKSKYTCTWEVREGADIADISQNGKLKIHNKDSMDRYINVCAKFKLKGSKDIQGEEYFGLWVSETFYNIDVSNIEVRKGKTVTVKPVLKWYSKDYPNGYTEKNVSFTYEANPGSAKKIQVKGNKITGLKTGIQDLIISAKINGQTIGKGCTVTVNP